jgi:hypothetical protein
MSSSLEHRLFEDDLSVLPAKPLRISVGEAKRPRFPAGVEVIEISSRSPSPSPAASKRARSGTEEASSEITLAPHSVPTNHSYDVCFGLVAYYPGTVQRRMPTDKLNCSS